MLEAENEYSKILKRVRLTSAFERGKRINRDGIQDISFPGQAGILPFGLQCNGNLVGKREPVLRLTFQDAIGDDALLTLSPPFVLWDNLIIRGGYLEDDDIVGIDTDLDIQAGLASQQTYLVSQYTVEHLLYEFVGHEAAFYSFVNMAIRLHHVFCPLELLEIE